MARDKGTGGGSSVEDSKNGQDGGPTACGEVRCCHHPAALGELQCARINGVRPDSNLIRTCCFFRSRHNGADVIDDCTVVL